VLASAVCLLWTLEYRSEVLHSWLEACQQAGVPCSDRFKLEAVLGNPVKVRTSMTQQNWGTIGPQDVQAPSNNCTALGFKRCCCMCPPCLLCVVCAAPLLSHKNVCVGSSHPLCSYLISLILLIPVLHACLFAVHAQHACLLVCLY